MIVVRREEFDMASIEETESFLQEMSFGVLGLHNGEYPYLVPLNFAYTNGNIYVYGSKIGLKMEALGEDLRVSFSVAKEYAIIPSYYSDPVFACPATAYFKSVLIRGKAAVVVDLAEKAEALSALMEKLQPEGGYDPIDPNIPAYASRVKGVAVVRITPEHLSAKFKFGQNLPEAKNEHIRNELLQRDKPMDAETAELMARYCPAHRSKT